MSDIYYQNYEALNNYRNQCADVVEIWIHRENTTNQPVYAILH